MALVGGPLVLLLGIGALVWFLVGSGPELARVAVLPGEPFRLNATCAGPVTLWCDVAVSYGQSLDLHGPIRASSDGADVWSSTFWLSPRGSTCQDTPRSAIKKRWSRTRGFSRGVTRVAKIGLPKDSVELTVEGTIEAGAGTHVEKLELFIAGSRGS